MLDKQVTHRVRKRSLQCCPKCGAAGTEVGSRRPVRLSERREDELCAIAADLHTVTRYRGVLCRSAAELSDGLCCYESLYARFRRVRSYAMLRYDEDAGDPENQSVYSRYRDLEATFFAATAFLKTEIQALSQDVLGRYLDEEPELSALRPYLVDLVADSAFVLPEETETALASLGEVLESPVQMYQTCTSTDIQFRPRPLQFRT